MPNNKKLNPIKSNQNRSYFNELKLKELEVEDEFLDDDF